MKYANGFYIYTPNEDNEIMDGLDFSQIIEINEGEIFITGVVDSFDIDYANAVGAIGSMVMDKDGKAVVPSKADIISIAKSMKLTAHDIECSAHKALQEDANQADEAHYEEIVEIQASVINTNKRIN